MPKLTKELIAALETPAAGQVYVWDDETTGFGVVVGHTGVRSYVVTGRVRGVKGGDGKDLKRRTTIGFVGGRRDDGHDWTLKLAREAAQACLVDMRNGVDPNAARRKAPVPTTAPVVTGPTLRDGMKSHLARMKRKQRTDASIRTFEYEMTKYLAAWLDRPIAELTGAVLVDLQEKIKENARDKANRNEANDKGAPLANRVVTHVSACWNSLNKKLEGTLGSWNPAKAVDKDVLKPKRERIADEDLPDYATRVATMRNPIQRDGLMLALYTGLRSEDVRTVRRDNVDLEEQTLRLPDPKGGEGAAFTIPLSKTPLEILRRRMADNERDLGERDLGWLFPVRDNEGEIGPIGDLRQQVKATRVGSARKGTDVRVEGTKHGRFPVEDVHTLRRTWESIAHEEGISELDQHVLSNHVYGKRNVNETYIAQSLEHLARCAKKIDDGITRRIKGSSKTHPRVHRAQ